MAEDPHPDPSLIGGVAKPPLAFLPDPIKLFQARARRFAFLAASNTLAPYLKFLSELSRLQARLTAALPPAAPMTAARIAEAAKGGMPPIDRPARARDPALAATLQAFTESCAELAMPEPARDALNAVRAANREDRDWLLSNIMSDRVPGDSTAPHLFAAAAVQVHMARLAATLDAGALVPLGAGLCPACGGRPATSSVMGTQGVENVRYATCACCATQWNEVRVKCLCCGSIQGHQLPLGRNHRSHGESRDLPGMPFLGQDLLHATEPKPRPHRR